MHWAPSKCWGWFKVCKQNGWTLRVGLYTGFLAGRYERQAGWFHSIPLRHRPGWPLSSGLMLRVDWYFMKTDTWKFRNLKERERLCVCECWRQWWKVTNTSFPPKLEHICSFFVLWYCCLKDLSTPFTADWKGLQEQRVRNYLNLKIKLQGIYAVVLCVGTQMGMVAYIMSYTNASWTIFQVVDYVLSVLT